MKKTTEQKEQEIIAKAHSRRAIHMALLLLMQINFTLWSFFVAVVIQAPVWLWGYWIVNQVIGWTFFLWQFSSSFVTATQVDALQRDVDHFRDLLQEEITRYDQNSNQTKESSR